MFRRRLLIAIAAIAFLFAGVGAASATTQSGNCSAGGTTTTVGIHYDTYYEWNYISWSTAPAAQLNRMQVETANDPSDDRSFDYTWFDIGGSSTSLNDVASSDDNNTSDGLPKTVINAGRYWRATVWGGVGNSNAVCHTPWRYIS
jgi:hypothetical protein